MLKIINNNHMHHKTCTLNELDPGDFFIYDKGYLCICVGIIGDKSYFDISNSKPILFDPIDSNTLNNIVVMKCSKIEIYYKTLKI